MGFVLKKCFRDRAVTITKATGNKADALDKLRVFLDATEPQTVKFLVSLWGEQQTAITYKELRENILSGDISPEQLEKWRIDYSNLINEKLAPQWKKAMVSAAEELKRKYPKFLYNPQNEFAQEYIKERGAFLVTNIVEEQRNALKAATMHALNLDDAMTADNLSRILRPMIGLTKSQAISNTNYYNTVYSKALEAGASESKAVAKAREAATRYAHRQERERAFTIARTELASAYNHGAYGATKDAQSKGYIGDCKKTWLTADDERVCKICGGVDGESVNMDAKFSIGVDLPPAHPNCRCGVAYEEIFSSILTFDIINDIIDNDTFNILDSSGEIQPEWQGVDYISSYTKQQAIERLNSEYGITFKDLKKYSMDEILLNDCVGWLDSFYFQYSDFMTNSPAKLPLIKILSPEKLGDAPGMYEFNEKTAKVVGIFLNGKYYNNIKLFQQVVGEQIQYKYWVANATTRKSFVHEFGHHISTSMIWINGNSNWEKDFIQECVDEFKKIEPSYNYNTYIGLQDYLSGSGTKDESECFAEAFAEYFGGKNPRKFAQIFGEKLDKLLKGG